MQNVSSVTTNFSFFFLERPGNNIVTSKKQKSVRLTRLKTKTWSALWMTARFLSECLSLMQCLCFCFFLSLPKNSSFYFYRIKTANNKISRRSKTKQFVVLSATCVYKSDGASSNTSYLWSVQPTLPSSSLTIIINYMGIFSLNWT